MARIAARLKIHSRGLRPTALAERVRARQPVTMSRETAIAGEIRATCPTSGQTRGTVNDRAHFVAAEDDIGRLHVVRRGYDSPWAWTPRRGAVVEIETLDEDQRAVLQAVYDRFHETGMWPAFAIVDRALPGVRQVVA